MLLRPKLFLFLQFIVFVTLFVKYFQVELTSAQPLKRRPKLSTIQVRTLRNLPVISITNGTEQICTGVFVGQKSIITSISCIKLLKNQRFRSHLIARSENAQIRVTEILADRGLKIGVIKTKKTFSKLRPAVLYLDSKMAFGKDFVVDGFGSTLKSEIGYINATLISANRSRPTSVVPCFRSGDMPSLVRRPTAVVGIPTYGFGECFFDSEVNFEDVGSDEVQQFILETR